MSNERYNMKMSKLEKRLEAQFKKLDLKGKPIVVNGKQASDRGAVQDILSHFKANDISGKTLAIYTIKGGVSKTTLSTNLATALTMLGYKVLFIDTDPQSNGTSVFNVQHEYSISDLFNGIADFEHAKCHYDTGYGILDIIPSNIMLFNTAEDLHVREERFILKKIIDEAKPMYDFIIVDCNPTINILAENVMIASDYLIAPVQLEVFSLDGYGNLINKIEDMRVFNSQLDILALVPVMYKSNWGLHNHILNDLKSMGLPIVSTIRQAHEVPLSQYNRIPTMLSSKSYKINVIKDFWFLAVDILTKLGL